MCIRNIIKTATVVILIALVHDRLEAQEAFDAIDSAVRTVAPRLRTEPAQLTALDIDVLKIELPPTVVPPDVLDAAQRRASDLNGDGRVDQADAALLQKAFGPCAGRQPCPGDLDGDNVVNEADAAILNRHIGAVVSGHEAQAERVGNVFPAPPALIPALPQQARRDGSRAMRLELRSMNARGVRLQFRGLASGMQLRIYDPVSG